MDGDVEVFCICEGEAVADVGVEFELGEEGEGGDEVHHYSEGDRGEGEEIAKYLGENESAFAH